MKQMKPMVIATLLLLGIGGAAAQSLGDYARAVRKDKAEPSSTSRHFDNDNLPANQPLSVVGPPPAADANAVPEAEDAKSKPSEKAAPVDPAAAAERQKPADEWKKKLDTQQEKVDSLNRDLDVAQREYRLRVATQYNSEANRLQNAGQWDKENEQYRNDTEAKQKAIDAARQDLDEMQEQARKAGVAVKDKDVEKDKDNDITNDNIKDDTNQNTGVHTGLNTNVNTNNNANNNANNSTSDSDSNNEKE